MFRHALCIFLTANVFACPWVCSGGICACPEPMEEAACCEKCKARYEQAEQSGGEREPIPVNPAGDPCEDCQCICGGAVFKDSADQALLKMAAEVAALACATANLPRSDLEPLLVADFVPDGRRAVSGRMICCLHMSYLC